MAAARASILKRLEQVLDKHGTIHVLRRGFSEGGDSVDLVLFVNGVPTATAELKNRWTGQTVEDGIEQYRTSRDPKIVLFARRAFVHFAIDAELAYLTTRLAKAETVVLPLNQGSNGPGRPGGKGNPGAEDGHALPPVARRRRMPDPRAAARRRTQLPHLALGGLGQDEGDCLVAHELSSLHADDDTKVFDKVFVITDRRVLDRQLRDQIAQFEQVAGVVRSVQESSKELREALLSKQAKVVTTTLQKFPFVLQALDEADESVKDRRYAVIVDEAHSSQTGDSATDLKAVLGSVKPDELDLDEDDGTPAILLARLAARGKQPNLSFFAFTATPKGKTLELFGRREPHSDTLAAFHTYSMRQAIEEGFIVDVLRNYTTFDQLARLETEADKALEVPKSRTSSFFSRFVDLHPYVKSQKAAIVVEHFKRVVRPLLEGQGKAMVVNRYVRFYSFLAQVLPYIPADAEVLFQFSRVLLKRLLSVRPDGGVNLSGIVELTHFRLEEIGTEHIGLSEADAKPLSAIGGDGTGTLGPGQIPLGELGELVEVFNERYGTGLGPEDALKVLEDVRDSIVTSNDDLAAQARANTREDFVRHRDDLVIGAALDVTDDRDKQGTLLKALLDDEDFRTRAGELIMSSIYDALGSPAP